MLAFSTGNVLAGDHEGRTFDVKLLSTDHVEPIFRAVVEATEEAVLNAVMKAETMTGINGNTVHALPHDRLRDVLKKYNRLR